MQFRDIIGQNEVKQQLRLSVQQGRIPHARLLTGKEGVGKLPLAIAFAQYLACTNRTDEDSCGECPACKQYAKLQHPDLHFVFPIVKTDAGDVCDDFMLDFVNLAREQRYFNLDDWYRTLGVETKQGMIYEKESAEILRKLSLKSYGDGYKVMIIWQPEKMNITCANKLLKLLEEPPEKTLFLLVSEHPEQLLSTILSRVQLLPVPGLSEEELTQQFGAEIAHIANGSYLAAKRLAENSEETDSMLEEFKAMMRDAYTIGVIQDKNKKFESLKRLIAWSQKIADGKVGRERQKQFLQYAQQQVRENFIRNLAQPQLNYQTSNEAQFSTRFAPFINETNVEKIMNELQKAEQQIAQNGNAKMIFFDMCMQMIVLIKNR